MYEKETIEYYNQLIKNQKSGDWQHSRVEDWKVDYFKNNFNEETLKNFKYNRLSDGTKPTNYKKSIKFYAKQIKKYPHDTILEIGSGFGALSTYFPDKAYMIVDLPENLALTYYFLVNKKQINKALIAPWDLPELKGEIDMFVNTMSFQHMTIENIKYYLNEVRRLKPKYLFLVNRDWKRDPTDVPISEYPIPEGYVKIKDDKYPYSDHRVIIYETQKRNS